MKSSGAILSFVLFWICPAAHAQSDDTLFVRYDLHNGDAIEYTTDTLFRKTSVEPHYLFQTDWITNTPNQLQAMSYGLFPLHVDADCIHEGIESGENQLVSIEKNDTTLTVKYLVAANCCYDFLCDMHIADSATLDLKYIEYGTVCGCTCYHDLIFTLKIDPFDEVSKSNFGKLKYLTLNGELKATLE